MNTKVIKGKIKSTGSIKKITRTMEMVSVAKMKKAVNMAEGYKSFGIEAKKIINILGDQREKHALTIKNTHNKKEGEVKEILIILIAGQKGLCGGYNSNLYRYIYKNYALEKSNLRFITIGKYGEKIAKKFDTNNGTEKEGTNILASFSGKEFTNSDARVITKKIISEYTDMKHREVKLIFTDFTNVNTQSVAENTLLPFSNETIKNSKDLGEVNNLENKNEKENLGDDLEYTFEPNVFEVFEYSVNVLLQNIISGSVTRARAAEHAARMMAMKTATDNAGEMLKELKTYFNKARQAAITQEILIVRFF
jgi:F-type H+-transporting ATPase subunit gamma